MITVNKSVYIKTRPAHPRRPTAYCCLCC